MLAQLKLRVLLEPNAQTRQELSEEEDRIFAERVEKTCLLMAHCNFWSVA